MPSFWLLIRYDISRSKNTLASYEVAAFAPTSRQLTDLRCKGVINSACFMEGVYPSKAEAARAASQFVEAPHTLVEESPDGCVWLRPAGRRASRGEIVLSRRSPRGRVSVGKSTVCAEGVTGHAETL
jgi:hypothetical protein